MIITKTPYRISLLGGGTDYPDWYKEHGGQVISFTIDKYCYILFRKLPKFFAFSNKVVYSKLETTQKVNDIQHPVVREALKYYEIDGVEIYHHGDLPAGGGMGSSSAFTVGMVNTLYTYIGNYTPSRELLASEAIHIERNLLGERVGNQDQVAAAFGGLNRISFFDSQTDEFEFNVEPVRVPIHKIKNLEQHLMLFFTGVPRKKIASDIVKTYDKTIDMGLLSQYVDAGVKAIRNDNPIVIGELLERSWELKQLLSAETTTQRLNDIYERGKKVGAVGGKLLGAGGGGFILFCVPPEKRAKVIDELSDLVHIPFKIEFTGSSVMLK